MSPFSEAGMKLRRLSSWFTTGGVILGSVAILGFALDLMPSLPAPVLKLVIYKLTFIGALGLVFFGAIMGRLARSQEAPPRIAPDDGTAELRAPMERMHSKSGEKVEVQVPPQQDR
jgi:hypothetical protein